MSLPSLLGREIAVPGSTSNLGPGFDALGLAIRCYLRLRVAAVGGGRPGAVDFTFHGRGLEGDNYIERGFRRLAGEEAVRFPALRVEVSSDIPMKAGLGSSGAALVAGFRLFEAVAGPQPTARLLDEAAAIEGHPDNTSASLLGGLVASCQTMDGHVAAIAVPWPNDLRLAVATPARTLETRRARQALPDRVPLADAVANVQRTALLVQAVAAGDRRWLREAFRDRLHQPYRAPLVPGLEAALALEHPTLLGVFLSGAGPSIVAVVSDDGTEARRLLETLYQRLGEAVTVRMLDVHQPARA